MGKSCSTRNPCKTIYLLYVTISLSLTRIFREAPHYRLSLLEQPRAKRFGSNEEEVFLAELKRGLERYLRIGPDHMLPNSYANLLAIKRGETVFSSPANTDFNDLHNKVQALETTILRHTTEIYDHARRLAALEDSIVRKDSLSAAVSKILPTAIGDNAVQDALARCKFIPRYDPFVSLCLPLPTVAACLLFLFACLPLTNRLPLPLHPYSRSLSTIPISSRLRIISPAHKDSSLQTGQDGTDSDATNISSTMNDSDLDASVAGSVSTEVESHAIAILPCVIPIQPLGLVSSSMSSTQEQHNTTVLYEGLDDPDKTIMQVDLDQARFSGSASLPEDRRSENKSLEPPSSLSSHDSTRDSTCSASGQTPSSHMSQSAQQSTQTSIQSMQTNQHNPHNPTSVIDPLLPRGPQSGIRRHMRPKGPKTQRTAPVCITGPIKLMQPYDTVTIEKGKIPDSIDLLCITTQPAAIVNVQSKAWAQLSLDFKFKFILSSHDENALQELFQRPSLAKSNQIVPIDQKENIEPNYIHSQPIKVGTVESVRVGLGPKSGGRKRWFGWLVYSPFSTVIVLSTLYLSFVDKYVITPQSDYTKLRPLAENICELHQLIKQVWQFILKISGPDFYKNFPTGTSAIKKADTWAKRLPPITEILYSVFRDGAAALKVRKPNQFVATEGVKALQSLRARFGHEVLSSCQLHDFLSLAPPIPVPSPDLLISSACLYPVYTVSDQHVTNAQNSAIIIPEMEPLLLNSDSINPFDTMGDNLENQVSEDRLLTRWFGDRQVPDIDDKHPFVKAILNPQVLALSNTNALLPPSAKTVLKQPAPNPNPIIRPDTFSTHGPNFRRSLEIKLGNRSFTKNILPAPTVGEDLAIVYTNLNAPKRQLGPLLDHYPRAAVIALSELDINPNLLKPAALGHINYTAFFHDPVPTPNGPRVYAAMLIHHELIDQVKEIKILGPSVMLYVHHVHFKINICVFYRPITNSPKHALIMQHFCPETCVSPEDFFLDMLTTICEHQYKVPAIICGDCNFQIIPRRPSDNQRLINQFLGTLDLYHDLIEGKTTFLKACSSSSIDCLFVKEVQAQILSMDTSGLLNDGHAVTCAILPYKINVSPITRHVISRSQLTELQINLLSYIIYPYIKEVLSLTEINSKCWINNSILATVNILQRDAQAGHITSINRENYKLHNSQAYSVILGTHLTFLIDLITPEQISTIPFRRVARLPSVETRSLESAAQVIKSHLANPSLSDEIRKAFTDKYTQIRKRFHAQARRDRRRAILPKNVTQACLNDIYSINRRMHCKTPKTIFSESFSAEQLATYFKKLQWAGADEKISRCTGIDIAKKWGVPTCSRQFRFEEFLPSWDGATKFDSVRLCLQSLKTFNQGHLTGYNKRFLSLLCHKFSDFLYCAVISDILLGLYPDHYLTNKIKPIPKKDPTAGIRNHRFISVPDPLASLTGKTAAAMCISYTRKYNLWSPRQHGFLPKRGTATAIAEIFLNLRDVPADSPVISASSDIENGFGSPPFSMLRGCLNGFTHPNTMLYFDNLLQPRCGIIYHDGKRSEPVQLPMLGVPQGEPCSPWMFNTLMDGLKVVLNHRKVHVVAYADDWFFTFVGDPGEEISSLEKLVVTTLNKTTEFLWDLGMKISLKKSFFIITSNHTLNRPLELTMGALQQVQSFTHLGFRMNKQLSSESQYTYVLAKLEEIHQILRNLLALAPRHQIIIVAYALIFGQLNYLAPVVPTPSNAQCNKIQGAICQILLDILAIPFAERRGISYATILNSVGWITYKNNISRLRAKYLHDLFQAKDPFRLFRLIQLMVKMRLNGELHDFDPYLASTSNEVDVFFEIRHPHLTKNLSQYELKITFPFSAMHDFNQLPQHVRVLFGQKSFVPTSNLHFHSLCQHRAGKNPAKCSRCSVTKVDLFSKPQLIQYYEQVTKEVEAALPLISEYTRMSFSARLDEFEQARKWAIETVLSNHLPLAPGGPIEDRVERSHHFILRELREANFIPDSFPDFPEIIPSNNMSHSNGQQPSAQGI